MEHELKEFAGHRFFEVEDQREARQLDTRFADKMIEILFRREESHRGTECGHDVIAHVTSREQIAKARFKFVEPTLQPFFQQLFAQAVPAAEVAMDGEAAEETLHRRNIMSARRGWIREEPAKLLVHLARVAVNGAFD